MFRLDTISGLHGDVLAFFADRSQKKTPSGIAIVKADAGTGGASALGGRGSASTDRDDFSVHRLWFREDGAVAENGHYDLTWERAVEVFLDRSGLKDLNLELQPVTVVQVGSSWVDDEEFVHSTFEVRSADGVVVERFITDGRG
jgi:hypothetical protein